MRYTCDLEYNTGDCEDFLGSNTLTTVVRIRRNSFNVNPLLIFFAVGKLTLFTSCRHTIVGRK